MLFRQHDSSFLILDELDLNLNSRFTCYLFFESCISIVILVFYYLILLIILFPLRFYFGVRVNNNCTEERAHRKHVCSNNLDHFKLRSINQ